MENHAAETPLIDPRVRPQLKAPVPVCTVYADASVRTTDGQRIPMIELQRLLLNSAALITQQLAEQTGRQAMVLQGLVQRFNLGEDVERTITEALAGPSGEPIGGD